MPSDLYVPIATSDDDAAPALPRHWSAEAKRVHARILSERPAIVGADLSSLHQACTIIAAADRYDRTIRTVGSTILGSTGQLVAHPLVSEVRQLRTAAASILDRLSPVQSRAEKRQQAGLNRRAAQLDDRRRRSHVAPRRPSADTSAPRPTDDT